MGWGEEGGREKGDVGRREKGGRKDGEGEREERCYSWLKSPILEHPTNLVGNSTVSNGQLCPIWQNMYKGHLV